MAEQIVNGGYSIIFFFSSRRRHTRCSRDWSSDVCSSDLVDMGVEPFLISSSVLAVLAQRLLRRLCDGCALEGQPADDERRRAGPGCAACRGTGYRGRSAIHELLVVDDPVRALVMARADAAQVRHHATAAGMATLRDDGLEKARAGVTTVAEVLRVTQDEG